MKQVLTHKSKEALERKFKHLLEKKGWTYQPVLQSCDELVSSTQTFTIAGAGEDERVMALALKGAKGENAVLVLATRNHGKARHAKFLHMRTCPGAAWWDPAFSLAIQVI